MDTNKKSDVIYHAIAMQYTKINDLFRTLSLLKGGELKSAIRQGEISVDAMPATRAGQKVNAGQVVRYKDVEIHVCSDEGSKGDRVALEMSRAGGFKGTMGGRYGGGIR